MRVAVVSANLGSYDEPSVWPTLHAPSGVTVDVHRFTDATCPPRPLAMTSRLQAGLVKMFAPWQFVPGYDAYLWIDASMAPTPNAIEYFLDPLSESELVVFRHPQRSSIREEYEFMKERMARKGERYLNARYKGEWLDALYREIAADYRYVDDRLFASTAFIYRPTERVKLMMSHWWLTKTRFLLHDQISWPYVIAKACCSVSVIRRNYLKCEALTFVRKGIRRAA
jgi:hypothetical protein